MEDGERTEDERRRNLERGWDGIFMYLPSPKHMKS